MTPLPFTLRAARADDHPAIARILSQGHDEHVADVPWMFRATPAPFPAGYFAELLADPTVRVFLGEVGGAVAGYAIAKLRDAPDIAPLVQRRFLYLEDLGVDRAMQRRGLGRALVETCVAWGRAEGATALELTVFEFNESARRLYEGLGMSTANRRMYRPL